jgi:hypothetical protein
MSHTTLSLNSTGLLHNAIAQAENGHLQEAQAALEALLMSDGITVGMELPGAMSKAVEHGVNVWQERLAGCPIKFVSGRNADLKVRFVNEISTGGDVQGELRVQRRIRWGSDGPGYQVKGTILVRDEVDGRHLTRSEVSAVVEHELGHLLGLDDDERIGMLMGPFLAGHPVDGPANEEVEAVSDFRYEVRRSLESIADSRRP